MAVENVKSSAITSLDASYVSIGTAGLAAPGRLWSLTDNVTAAQSTSINSTYRLCRMPSNAIIKRVWLNNPATTAGAIDINVAFSDSTTDGTTVANQSTVPQISAANNKLFGAATSTASANSQKDITFNNIYTPVQQNMELWNALLNLSASFASGVSFDPGGFFDIFLVVTTAFTVASTTLINVEVDFFVGD